MEFSNSTVDKSIYIKKISHSYHTELIILHRKDKEEEDEKKQ